MGWTCRLLEYLPPLALLAVPALGCHILANTLPHNMCSHQAIGGTYARVGHAVNGVENGTVREWHQWPGDAMCHIAQQVCPSPPLQLVLTVR
jgi:hypothetical protein